MKTVVLAHGAVGQQATFWLLENFPEDIAAIFHKSEVWATTFPARFRSKFIHADNLGEIESHLKEFVGDFDIGLLIWWPHLIPTSLIQLASIGFFNTHPSFLPHNRGKNYNFWALVEESPFGVSIHRVTSGIDTGAIISQKRIPYSWEDNGGTLFEKAAFSMLELFTSTYPTIRDNTFSEIPQDLRSGSFHSAEEMEEASRIILEKSYPARHLLNLLRARTFAGFPACSFTEHGQRYEVRVEIKKVDD